MSAAPERPDLIRELRWVATQPDVQSIGIHTSSAGGQGVIGVSPRALVAFLDWVAALEAQRDAAREALAEIAGADADGCIHQVMARSALARLGDKS